MVGDKAWRQDVHFPRGHPAERSTRVAAAALAAALAVVLTGCSGPTTAGGETTCNEWLELDLPVQEAFENLENGEDNLAEVQQDILRDALGEQDLATDETNIAVAALNVAEFCAADGTGTRPNADTPISGALE